MKRLLVACLLLATLISPFAAQSAPARQILHQHRIWVTGYLPTGNRTYDGSWPYYGTGGSDLRTIPLHTMVTIRGLGRIWINDTGSSVRPYQVDMFVYSLSRAYAITGYYQASWWS